MRRLLLLVFIGVTASGCNDKKDPPVPQPTGTSAPDPAASAQAALDQANAAASAQAAKATSAEHEAARADIQKNLDAADRKLAYLKERAAKLTGSKKADVLRAQSDTESKRATLASDVAQLTTSTGASWDTARAAATGDMTAFTQSMDRFETMVTGQPAH